jgi:hypothetical protein
LADGDELLAPYSSPAMNDMRGVSLRTTTRESLVEEHYCKHENECTLAGASEISADLDPLVYLDQSRLMPMKATWTPQPSGD